MPVHGYFRCPSPTFAIWGLAIWLGASGAQAQEPAALDQSNKDDVVIFSDEAEYLDNQRLELKGNVEIQQGDYTARGQHALIDQSADQARLDGGIDIVGPELEFSGNQADLNLRNGEAEITDAKFHMPMTGLRGNAKALVRKSSDKLIIQEGSFTTCEPEDPDWAFLADEIELDRETGFGVARHTRFEVNDTPILYVPWFTFPIDDRRKSGFLYPSFGSANTGRGAFVSTPFYWNIAPQADATITPTYINKRGLHTEVEGRHLGSMTRSNLTVSYIESDDYYLSENTNVDDGERWGLSFEQKLDLEDWVTGWDGAIEYAAVSDNDYLDDLDQGLQIVNTDSLDRRLDMRVAQDNWRLGVLLQQYKSLDEDLDPNEQAYQRLPEINYHQFFRSDHAPMSWYDHFDADWRTQYVYFYRDPDNLLAQDRTHGSRIRHELALRLPLSRTWGFAEAGISVNHADYLLEDYPPQENHLQRTIPTYEIDSGLYFDRPSRWFNHAYRLTWEPRAYYVYTPAKNQDDIPNFDTSLPSFDYSRVFSAKRFSGDDRIGDNNRISVGFTSRWIDDDNGRERASLSIAQLLHFENREVLLEDLKFEPLGKSAESDRFIASEFILRPTKALRLSAAGLYDQSRKATQESVARISYRDENYDTIVNLNYRYLSELHEQGELSSIIPVGESASLLGRWQYDLETNRTIGTLAGIEYQSCCWRFQVLTQRYLTSDSEIDHGILFRFVLHGLGGIGEKDGKMDKLIPGYAAREATFN